MADRSNDSIGRSGSKWTVDGPSKSPARSPRTRRASAWATSRPSLRSSSTVEPAKGHSGSSIASTTIGRTGVELSHLAVSSAVSSAVRSVARSARPSVASARAASRPSRLALTCACHEASSSPEGRGPSSSGLRRAEVPTPSSTAWPPRARVTTVHSPFGSPGTYTRRPKATQRAARDFARVDFPRPIWPARQMLGLVSAPWR